MTIRPIIALMALAIAAHAFAEDSPPPPSTATSIAIKGSVEHPRTLALADLQRAPATTETVFFHTGHGPIMGSFTGVSLWALLQEAHVKLDPAKKNDAVRHEVLITGSDGYSVVLSLGELSPEFGSDQAIVAYAKDGKPLEDRGGFARLVIPGDKTAARSVAGIASIEVK